MAWKWIAGISQKKNEPENSSGRQHRLLQDIDDAGEHADSTTRRSQAGMPRISAAPGQASAISSGPRWCSTTCWMRLKKNWCSARYSKRVSSTT